MQTVDFPAFSMPFPTPVPNPAAQDAESAMWPWVDAVGLCPAQADHDRLAAADIALLVGLLYPTAPLDTLTMLARYYAWIFVNDDLFDENISNDGPGRCHAALQHVIEPLDGGTARGPVARALADVWQWGRARQGPSWQDAFRTHTRDAVWCHYTVAANRRSRQLPHWEQYLAFRRDDIGALPFLDMCEPATGTDLPDSVRRLSAHTELVHSAALFAGLCNDFYSLCKEREGGYHSDVFAVLHTYEGLTLDEAVVRADAEMTRCVQRMQSATRQLLAQLDVLDVAAAVRADTHTCVQAYQDLVSGIFAYHAQAPRFSTPEPSGDQGRPVSDLFRTA